MKGHYSFDIGQVLEEIFEATRQWGDAVATGMKQGAHEAERVFRWDENTDFYPAFSYPPANVYLTKERKLVFEFALAGFTEEDLDLQFQGDFMSLSAKAPERDREELKDARYFKHRLKFKDIKGQKYYVPADKFDRDKVKAVYRKGILAVEIPPLEEYEADDGIKIEIEINKEEEV
jgi:HSP20 family protein